MARVAGGNEPGVPGATRVPSAAIYWPAASGAGTGISQVMREPAVWASAGLMVTTVDAAAAPSASTIRRLGWGSAEAGPDSSKSLIASA